MPVQIDGRVVWKEYRTLDTFYGTLPYWDRPDLQIRSVVETLANQAVSAGAGQAGNVAYAPSWIFNAPQTVQAVRTWLEEKFATLADT
jgi:hypothetical protein